MVEVRFCEITLSSNAAENITQTLQEFIRSKHQKSQGKTRKLPILTEQEQQKILVIWNDTKREYPKNKTIHQLFEEQVRKTPNNIAVVYENKQLTYKELNERANQFAHYLREQGIGPDKLVAICMERSFELIVGLLAILKAGGAYVPLDPDYPVERIHYIIEDAGIEWLLTQQSKRDIFSTIQAQIIAVDAEKTLFNFPVMNLSAFHESKQLAYVIYTSGSTGKPKGVAINHHSVLNFLMGMQAEIHLVNQDRWLAVTTISFNIAGLEIYLPLTCGAKLLLASRSETKDAYLLSKKLNYATIMQATPSMWKMLLDSNWRGDNGKLKILCGGEALTESLAKQLVDNSKQAWNVYGPTETTIWSTLSELKKDTQVTLGKGISNTRTYILDKHLEVVPQGVIGELYIGGAGLARGYLYRPDLTSERFIANPFATVEDVNQNLNTRLYKTGDLCRYLSDGNIEYLGRIDHQVKIRGFRIELGEIEGNLVKHPAIKEAVVMAREDDPGNKQLVAYYVIKKTNLFQT